MDAPPRDWAWECRQRVHVEGATGAWAISTWLCGLPAPAGRQQPRVHMMSRWRSACAGTKRQRSQWGEGSSRRSEYGEVRGTCPLHDHVSIMHGSDTHHAYRPTEDVVSGERLVSFFTFRAAHRAGVPDAAQPYPKPRPTSRRARSDPYFLAQIVQEAGFDHILEDGHHLHLLHLARRLLGRNLLVDNLVAPA